MKTNIFLTLAATLLLSTSAYAQLRVADYNVTSNAPASSAFIDASSYTVYNSTTNIGKGLLFPRVDLTTFSFSPAAPVGIPNNYPTLFDGMIVYNTATSGTAFQGITAGGALTAGFWYYENKSATLTGGIWKPFGDTNTTYTIAAGSGAGAVMLTGNDGSIQSITVNVNDADYIIGNEVTDATDLTLVRSGSGTATAPYTLARAAIIGDVSIPAGNNSATVVGLQGKSVSSTTPTTNQVLKWNGSAWAPAADEDTKYTGIAPIYVNTSNQVSITAGTNGQVLTTDASGNATWATPANTDASHTSSTSNIYDTANRTFLRAALTGDATAAQNSNVTTVERIQGRSVSSAAPGTGQVLKWNGSAWAPADDANTTTYWSLTGNAGTSPGTPASPGSNFLGTTDNQALMFRVNNTPAGFISNVDGQNNNNAFGYNALKANNSSGTANNAFGLNALKANTSGIANSAFGWNALSSNTTGSYNTAIGNSTLRYIYGSGATHNTAIGSGAMDNASGGTYNTALGANALGGSASGTAYSGTGYNTAVGGQTLMRLSSGTYNTAVGTQSGTTMTSGGNNTIIGSLCGTTLTTGSYNILIGYQAAPSSASVSNEVTIGTSTTTTKYRMYATSWTNASDRRMKHDIRPLGQGLSFIEKLKPVEFIYNSRDDGKKTLGFIAQDVKKIMSEENMDTNVYDLVSVMSESDGTLGMNYTELIPVLTKAIQEQQKIIKQLEARLQVLEAASN